jgi:hypothetical protein
MVAAPDRSIPRIPEPEQDVRELAGTAGLVVLALAGVFAVAVGVLGASAHCYDVCGLALLFVFAAAVSGFRGRYSTAAVLVSAAGPTLAAWLLVVT